MSRRANKMRTYQKLLRGAIRLIHRSGLHTLTTGKVASESGMAQPTFYVHFADMNTLLQKAASELSDAIFRRLQPIREQVMDGPSRESVRAACATAVNALVDDPRYAEIYLRYRRDPHTPLGERFLEFTDEVRGALYSDLCALGLNRDIPHLEIHVEMIFGMTLGLIEAIVDRRIGDLEIAVDLLAESIIAQLESHSTRARDVA